MLSEEYPELGITGPQSIGATSVTLHLHVDDCDAVLAKAVELGGVLLRPPSDAFYGERGGTVRDPFGHEWMVRTRSRRSPRRDAAPLHPDDDRRL